MAKEQNPEYVNFFEVMPAEPETATAEADDNFDDDNVDLEDMEDSFEESEDEPEEEPEESDEPEDEPEAESESEEPEAEKAEEPKEDLTDDEKLKAHNREMAQKRLEAKQQREAAIKQKQQEYVAEADPEDPREIAVRQLQVDAYNNKVESNTNRLTNGYERAMKDFDVLRDASPEIQAELDAALDAFQALHVTMDVYGNPVEVRGDLYSYLQAKADSIKALTGKGARQQIQDKSKEKSKTLSAPSRAPKEPKSDPALDGFDEEANRY